MSVIIQTQPGTPLRDLLFGYGVEFPCGGNGRCRRCRVQVLEGEVEPGAEDIQEGWVLGCRAVARTGLTLAIGQWEAAILSDESPVVIAPRPGRGIAIDCGTTTLVAQLVSLETGAVLGVRTAVNPQGIYGADVMSRVQHALGPAARTHMKELIRAELGRMCRELSDRYPVETVCIAGNTVMMHLFAGFDTAHLSRAPFEPEHLELQTFSALDLGWPLSGNPPVYFLPCPGGFVGSDILAGVIATAMDSREDLHVLIDLGTNGEIVAGTRALMLCASTAAGPAFEGGRISCGMRAATGAIYQVSPSFECAVIGSGHARGVCGSGLVDAIAAGLLTSRIRPNGRMAASLPLRDGLYLTQPDIREVQLAKAATSAGVEALLHRLGATPRDVRRVHLAGAFGNYINRDSARRLGMIGFPEEVIEPSGNTALLGAKVALLQNRDLTFHDLLARMRHVSLGSDPDFQDRYVEHMTFPPGPPG